MTLQSEHIMAALGVCAVFLFLAGFAITLGAANRRDGNLWFPVVAALVCAPLAALVFLAWAFVRPLNEMKARGVNIFSTGKDGVVSLTGILAAVVINLSLVGTTYWVFHHSMDLHGELLQAPVIYALIVSGLISGAVQAALAKRVAFVEALCVTFVLSLLPILAASTVGGLFTYGTAPAYYAVVLFSGALISLIAQTLGGSFGYLLTGDGGFSGSWSYENWIARRFLMGKRGSNVVGIITVISVLAVAVGTCAMVVVMSVMNGFSTDLKTKIFGSNAHLLVLKYSNDFNEYGDVAKKTRHLDGVKGVSPFVLNEVMVSSDVNLTGALLKGIEESTIDEVSELRQNITRGDLTNIVHPEKIAGAKKQPKGDDAAGTGQKKKTSESAALDAALAAATAGTPAGAATDGKVLPGVVIGKEMARNLKVFVGDVISVVSPVGELGPTGPVPKARAFRVAAIFYSGMYEYDSKFIYIDLAEAQSFFGLEGGVTGVEYKVFDVDNVQAVSRSVLKVIGGYPYRTKDWMEMNRNLFSALKLEKIAMFIILTFIILIASFLITATLIVFVIEKSKEISILKSMGATDTSIMKVFVVYGVIVGGLGAMSGLLVGFALCWVIQTFGIGLDPDVYYIENLPVHVEPVEVLLVGLSAVILSYLATIYPALLAARLRPVEGLRFE